MKRALILVVLLVFLLPSSGRAQDCGEEYCIYLPIVFAYNPCQEVGVSDWKIIIPENTTNQVLNPSAETTANFAIAIASRQAPTMTA
jgi:hypothetical protein